MTNQENLPVWAKILLGIPVNQTVLPERAEPAEKSNSIPREGLVSEFAQTEQRVRAYNSKQSERTWSWEGGFCPATREAS